MKIADPTVDCEPRSAGACPKLVSPILCKAMDALGGIGFPRKRCTHPGRSVAASFRPVASVRVQYVQCGHRGAVGGGLHAAVASEA